MGAFPFTPVFLEGKKIDGQTLSLSADEIIVLPSISAFIGADVTAGLAALDILQTPSPALFIDIGTNGEMALFNRGKIICCSTAAGPVFEGAEISCGTGAVSGAIKSVELSELSEDISAESSEGGAISITTFGNAPPVGICGSGLIDAVAVMLKLGVINDTGFMPRPEKKYFLADNVSVSAEDIRQFQLAKSAIFSGIKILCKKAGIQTADIKNVFIAGGLGFFINKQNAADLGIFPYGFLDPISVCGNLSLKGAQNYLCNKDFPDRCKHIINQCSVIDLAADLSFMDEFAENMVLIRQE